MIRAVIAQLVEPPTEKPGDAILTRVRVPGAANDLLFFLSQCQLPVQTLTVSTQSPQCVQLHESTSVRTLNSPNTGSHPIVWTLETMILHTLIHMYMGSAALAAALLEFPAWDKETLKRKEKKEKKSGVKVSHTDTYHREFTKAQTSLERQ